MKLQRAWKVLKMNIFHIANLRGHPEHPEQVDSENKDMEESIRTMVNIIRYTCGTICKMPASRDVKFVINKTKSRWTVRTRTWRSPSGSW